MKDSSEYLGNIHAKLASMSSELNGQLGAIDKSDGSFEKIDTYGKRPIICWTYQCDVSCPGCYAQTLKQNFSGQVMPAGEFGRVLDLYQQTLIHFDGVTLLGGEPTTPNTFSDLLQELEKRKLSAAIYTNGMNLRDNTDIFGRIIGSSSIDQVTMHFQASHLKDPTYLRRIEQLSKGGKMVTARYDFHKRPMLF